MSEGLREAARVEDRPPVLARVASGPMRSTEAWARTVIGRTEALMKPLCISDRVLVTGAKGSVGSELVKTLRANTIPNLIQGYDIDDMDIRDADQVREVVQDFDPVVIVHCAAAKHAPKGEEDPYGVLATNAMGTKNVLDAARHTRARVVTISTGKACDPETAYGASKLVAERMTLNEPGGTVARLFNVVESSGNVFEIWRDIPEEAPLLVTNCSRRFMTMYEALGLVFHCITAQGGRWSLGCTIHQTMFEVASSLYPDRQKIPMLTRRGDRIFEPEMANCESARMMDSPFMRVTSPHDPKEEGYTRAD